MKKIKKKILLFIGLILIFTSILGIAATPVRAHTEEEPFIVDLIAGGGNEKSAIDVGDILVWNDADFLYVEYSLIDGWCLTETHLHIASDPIDFPQTNKGNPIPGHFTYNDEWEPCKTEQTYTIPLTWSLDETLYIAAHAVVQKIIGYEPDLIGFELVLPDQVTMTLAHPGDTYGDPSYFDVTISGGTSLDGTYDNFCIDTDNTISSGVIYTANVYSSYEDLPEGLVEYPENLDLVNWIINQDYVGQPSLCGGLYTYGDVQRAIWALIEDTQSTSGLGPWSQCRVDEILAEANLFGEGFEPECSDVVAVILAPIDDSQITTAQVTFAEVGLPCIPIYQEETAWGVNKDDPLRFNDKNWATYFTYELQITITFPEEGNAYIGYEDRTAGDFDYNDFGMNMYVLETYVSNKLRSIHLEFTSVVHKAGDNHDIHISRILSSLTDYTYNITRTHAAYGTETAAGTDISGSGTFDIILFDSSDPDVVGKTVIIDITILTKTEMYDPSPTPPRWDLDPVFAYYDPWMYDKSYGPNDWHIISLQSTTAFGDSDPGIEVPYIITVPYTDWPAPMEGQTITLIYPNFDDYYRTNDPLYSDWYLP